MLAVASLAGVKYDTKKYDTMKYGNRSSTNGYFCLAGRGYLVNIFTTDRKYQPNTAVQILPSFISRTGLSHFGFYWKPLHHLQI